MTHLARSGQGQETRVQSVLKFEKECHKFTSSFQIRTWFKEALIYGDEEVGELDDEYEGAGNYGILKLKRDTNQESKNVLLKTENYAFASNKCNDTSLEYPTQYSCTNLGHYDMRNKRRNVTRLASPIPERNRIIRRRRTTSESEELKDGDELLQITSK